MPSRLIPIHEAFVEGRKRLFRPATICPLFRAQEISGGERLPEKFCRADESGIAEFHAWNACFPADSLTEELASSGFEVMNFYDDARVRPLAGGSDTIAACAGTASTYPE